MKVQFNQDFAQRILNGGKDATVYILFTSDSGYYGFMPACFDSVEGEFFTFGTRVKRGQQWSAAARIIGLAKEGRVEQTLAFMERNAIACIHGDESLNVNNRTQDAFFKLQGVKVFEDLVKAIEALTKVKGKTTWKGPEFDEHLSDAAKVVALFTVQGLESLIRKAGKGALWTASVIATVGIEKIHGDTSNQRAKAAKAFSHFCRKEGLPPMEVALALNQG